MEDLAAYELRESEAISLEIAGRRVWTVPPEGGGAMLLELLGVLDRDEVKRHPWGSAPYHHYLAQAAKLAFIGRREYLGDVSVAGNAAYEGIFDPITLARRFACIDPLRDTPTDHLMEQINAVAAPSSRDAGKNTTHFAVIDAEGNAVSCSYTMNLRYGSKWAIRDAGFLVNGSMDSFSFVEGRENYFGVIGSAPNLFAPGKRPASNMAPTLVTRGVETEMALGTPGGPTIPTALGAILAATLFHQVPPAQVVAGARLHHQGWPDKLSHEPGFPDTALLAALGDMGYTVKDKQELISDIQGVFKDGDGYLAVSDWRREGKALALG
jgi:gamma-glutamyltranspeptidase/glutathione hydrolase